MKISQTLPQFVKEIALFIVTGSKEADFYVAQDGEINKVDSFLIEKPEYSDREDFGRGGGSGRVFETGAKIEHMKKNMEKEFLAALKQKVQVLTNAHTFTQVYLFAAHTVLKEAEAELPTAIKSKIKRTFPGNYHKEHVFKLLEKINTLP